MYAAIDALADKLDGQIANARVKSPIITAGCRPAAPFNPALQTVDGGKSINSSTHRSLRRTISHSQLATADATQNIRALHPKRPIGQPKLKA